MNMAITGISKEKRDYLVASGYYDMTSSNGLLEIPTEILEDLFRWYKDPTVENLIQRLPEGTDIYDYGDICHKLVSNGYDLRRVYFFLLHLAWYGYNFKLKNGENDYTALQEFLLHLETGPVNAFNYSCYGPGGNYSSSAIDIFSFFQSRVGINVKDKFGNSILHTLIIDCRYKESIVQILITIAQRFESENFDFECKNNRNMGIIETLDECINKYSKSNDKSVQEKGKLLSDESEEIKKIINGLIKYKKDQSRIISEKDKNNKTEIEIYEIQDKISFILENTPFYEKSDYFSETHNAFKEIVDDMKYYRNKITNNIVFDLDTILAVKKTMDMEYKIILSYFPGLTRTFPSPIFLQSAAMKARKCIRNDKENEEEVTARRNLNEIGMKEIEDAMVKVTMGPEKKTKVRSEKENRLVAYHEAGHAVVSHYLETQDPVHQISIVPRGMAGGYTMYRPTEDKSFMSKTEMEENIVSLLGGRVAEALILNDISTGASNDIERATGIARSMVTKYGMSDRIGALMLGSNQEQVFLGRDIAQGREYSEETAAIIDEETKRIVDTGYNRAKQILSDNIDKLHQVAGILLEKEKIEADEFEAIFGKE